MKNYTVLYSDSAQNDLTEIFEYIAYTLKEVHTAQNLIRKIMKNIELLKTMPVRFPVDENIKLKIKIRTLNTGKFITFYSVDEKSLSVKILRIIFGGRDFDELFLLFQKTYSKRDESFFIFFPQPASNT